MSPPLRSLVPDLPPSAPPGGRRFDVLAAYDLGPVAEAESATAETVDRALSVAHALFRDRDRWMPKAERLAVLERAGAALAGRQEEFARRIAVEGGKPLRDARVEARRAVESLKSAVTALRAGAGREVPTGLTPADAGRVAFTVHEPIGVVAAISAFNHPLNLIAHQVAPAVAAGCPVVVKPSELTPLSCVAFVELLRGCGLPEDACQVVLTDERDVAQALATDPRVAFLSFIGSAAVGWMLRSKAAPGTRCALEHGGAAPVVVARDADLDGLVAPLVRGGFYHAGQVCISVQRVFAVGDAADDVAERLGGAAARLRTGDPLDEATDVGPLVRPREADRVLAWVEEAVAGGARVVAGGTRLSPSCVEPTVLLDPPDASRLARLEVFGPVVAVFRCRSVDEAVARANALPFAFQASVFTRDLDVALRCARRLDASAVLVNDATTFRTDWMPLAGLRQSGLGVGGIDASLREMQVEKMVVLRSGELA